MDYQSNFPQTEYSNMSFNTSFMSSSKIDSLNASAKAIIAQKDAEIEELNRQIDEAEQYLDQNTRNYINNENNMQSEIQSLQQELAKIQIKSEQDLEFLQQKQKREINALNEKHSQEVQKLKKQINKASMNQSDISNKQYHASQMRKSSVSALMNQSKMSRSNLDELSSVQEQTRVGYDDPELKEAELRAEESRKEVEELEAQLSKLVNEKKEKEIQAKKTHTEVKKRKDQAKTAAQQQQLQDKENQINDQIQELKGQLKGEIDKLQTELQSAIDANNKLDKQLAKVLAENAAKANDLVSMKSSITAMSTNGAITTSELNPSQKNKFTGATVTTLHLPKRDKDPKASTVNPRSLAKLNSMNGAISDSSLVEAEIIRLIEENNDLKKELRRLDKLVYFPPQ